MRRAPRTLSSLLLLLLCMLCACERAGAQRFINEGLPAVGPWTYFGPDQNRTIGNTFDAVPTAALLQSFAFWLGPSSERSNVRGIVFTPSIRAWNGVTATGPTLWQGSAVTTGRLDKFTRYDFATPGILLPEGLFVAILSAIDDGYHVGHVGAECSCDESSNPNVKAVAADFVDGSNPSTGPWFQTGPGGYSGSFEAVFASTDPPVTSTPEPASVILLGTGLAAILAFKGRRAKA